MKLSFWLNGKQYNLNLEPQVKNIFVINYEGKIFEVVATFITEEEILLIINNRVYNVLVQSNSTAHNVIIGERKYQVEKRASLASAREQKIISKKSEVKITMPGKVVAVQVENGAQVKEGQAVLILEAMKMQNEIKAPRDGRVANLKVKPGDTVEAGTVLFTLD
ncbi:MAG: acetyl-CoA carboxylase biotin carboxyl carrier protein subunit [Candidatus Aminicenantes bacterium]|nr:acetyl-CoA carboxylase biotin carboxyl carrier protein subunit [Candidatus Aminicenantes bacterium]